MSNTPKIAQKKTRKRPDIIPKAFRRHSDIIPKDYRTLKTRLHKGDDEHKSSVLYPL